MALTRSPGFAHQIKIGNHGLHGSHGLEGFPSENPIFIRGIRVIRG
jgi:hypothetical protein